MLKENLVHYRNKENMSQEELANKVCVSRSAIALYEKGIRNPTKETIKLICNALNISVEDLTDQRNIKRSIINLFLCIIGLIISIFPLMFCIYEFILEYYFYNKLIFLSFTNKTNELLTYISSFVLGILMYYLLFSNLKKSIKKTVNLILTIPIFISFIIYTINQNANIYANVPDSVIYYVFIPLLVLYYIFINYFIIKNLILEASYLKERVKDKYINIFYITINVLYICIVIASIVFVYSANVRFYNIETLYYEYDGSYQVLKSYDLVSLFSIMHTKKAFTLIFMIFQISISVFSLISIIIKNIRTREILTVINICLSIIFIILWTVYPRIFVEILQEIRFIHVD